MVKSIDREQGKVILSYKETLGSWEENVEKFTTGIKVKGKVRETEKHKNGIFIEQTFKYTSLLSMVKIWEIETIYDLCTLINFSLDKSFSKDFMVERTKLLSSSVTTLT